MNYAIITENDVSQWSDKTDSKYHFPKRYAKYLTLGTTVVYYKGKLKDTSFRENGSQTSLTTSVSQRANRGRSKTRGSEKGDLFVTIENSTPLKEAVHNKLLGTDEYIVTISESRAKKYWRDGVRPIKQETFGQIAALEGLSGPKGEKRLGDESSFTSVIEEGSKQQIYSTRYERDPKLRKQAI